MSIDTNPYRSALRQPETDFTTWETGQLRPHIGHLLLQQETANPRKAEELEHRIQYGFAELRFRQAEQTPAQAAGSVVMQQEAAAQ